ncbi:SHOCT domain-containing protein [Psychromarinibacter sp. C21-152]|uniref:SHOCT domain-containing protein n=1 Tax=Psychromarinibacter sediminicola TaxID=3033385 RepID=A0AAE3NW61_9RHOB|nr:SHOCT domain-containing protein [Psychromarinibacter sediminicola]MDF0603381.1 SHOCT domain-containing protein [Psychromarinibacter sediminicola]
MKRKLTALAAPLFSIAATAAAAQNTTPTQQWPDNWHGGYDHMMWGGGFGFFGGLMMLVFWAALIALVVLAVRWFDGTGGSARTRRNEAMDILRQRFAKGEIDEEEFRRRKAALED